MPNTGNNEGTQNQGNVIQWRFENATPVHRFGAVRKYMVSLTAGTLGLLFQNGIIQYEGEAQRGSRINNRGTVTDIYSKRKIKEIVDAMVNDSIHGGLITLNYSKNNEHPMEYTEEEFAIQGYSPLTVPDGQHRVRSCAKWLKAHTGDPDNVPNPDDFEFVCVVENLDIEGCKTLFAEYALTPAKISKTRAEYLNVQDVSNKIARHIMTNSQLKNKVEIISTSTKGKNVVVTFATLTTAIRNNIKPSTDSQINKAQKFLVSFFNELTELFPEQLGNKENGGAREEAKKDNFVIEAIIWNAYLAVASALSNARDWKEKLKKLTNEVTVDGWTGKFLSKENPLFNHVFRENGSITNNTSTVAHMTKVLNAFVVDGKEPEQILIDLNTPEPQPEPTPEPVNEPTTEQPAVNEQQELPMSAENGEATPEPNNESQAS